MIDDGIAFRVEGHSAHGGPVSGGTRPPGGMPRPCSLVEFVPCPQDGSILSSMTLRWGHVADATVEVFAVVPLHEAASPLTCGLQVSKALGRELRPVLCRLEERFNEGVIVRDA